MKNAEASGEYSPCLVCFGRTIAGGQGPAVTQEEAQSVVDVEGVLDLLMDNLMATFSPLFSGAETE